MVETESQMCIGLHVKCRLFLSDFNENGTFQHRFSKNNQISNFMKILPVGAELFHAEERTTTDRHTNDEVNNRFSQFSESAH